LEAEFSPEKEKKRETARLPLHCMGEYGEVLSSTVNMQKKNPRCIIGINRKTLTDKGHRVETSHDKAFPKSVGKGARRETRASKKGEHAEKEERGKETQQAVV